MSTICFTISWAHMIGSAFYAFILSVQQLSKFGATIKIIMRSSVITVTKLSNVAVHQ